MKGEVNPYAARRVGSVVQYVGTLPGYQHTRGEIVSIDQLNDGEDSYVIRVKNWKNEVEEIRAYQKDVRDERMSVALLEKIGFQKEEKRSVYGFKGVNIIDATTMNRADDGNVQTNWHGWVVVEKQIAIPLQYDEVVKNTLPVPALHILQNYLADRYKIVVDPDALTTR